MLSQALLIRDHYSLHSPYPVILTETHHIELVKAKQGKTERVLVWKYIKNNNKKKEDDLAKQVLNFKAQVTYRKAGVSLSLN